MQKNRIFLTIIFALVEIIFIGTLQTLLNPTKECMKHQKLENITNISNFIKCFSSNSFPATLIIIFDIPSQIITGMPIPVLVVVIIDLFRFERVMVPLFYILLIAIRCLSEISFVVVYKGIVNNLRNCRSVKVVKKEIPAHDIVGRMSQKA